MGGLVGGWVCGFVRWWGGGLVGWLAGWLVGWLVVRNCIFFALFPPLINETYAAQGSMFKIWLTMPGVKEKLSV